MRRALLQRAARTVRRECGYTVIEVLVASSLMIVVLGATLGSLDHFQSTNSRNQSLNEDQERARMATARLALQLRSLASPVPGRPNAIEKHEPDDLVFMTVADCPPPPDDPEAPPCPPTGNPENAMRVRYCLDGERPGRLVTQSQGPWTEGDPPPTPATAQCPDPAWGGHQVLVDGVANRLDGEERPVWLYNGAAAEDITAIRTDLFIDGVPGEAPPETRLSSGVLLRNQNRAPVAAFSATDPVDGWVRLNGSASSDPEGGNLEYRWSVDGEPVGEGVVLDWTAPSPGSRNVTLVVEDSGGLTATASQEIVF